MELSNTVTHKLKRVRLDHDAAGSSAPQPLQAHQSLQGRPITDIFPHTWNGKRAQLEWMKAEQKLLGATAAPRTTVSQALTHTGRTSKSRPSSTIPASLLVAAGAAATALKNVFHRLPSACFHGHGGHRLPPVKCLQGTRGFCHFFSSSMQRVVVSSNDPKRNVVSGDRQMTTDTCNTQSARIARSGALARARFTRLT